jgi:hypothetical protein
MLIARFSRNYSHNLVGVTANATDGEDPSGSLSGG